MLSCPSACGLMQQYSWFHSYHWWHHHLDCHWVAAAGSDVEVDGVPVGALTSSAFLLSQLAPFWQVSPVTAITMGWIDRR